ncbi:MAG: hypothetical protein RI949_261 [Pseudomonadota bacterium]
MWAGGPLIGLFVAEVPQNRDLEHQHGLWTGKSEEMMTTKDEAANGTHRVVSDSDFRQLIADLQGIERLPWSPPDHVALLDLLEKRRMTAAIQDLVAEVRALRTKELP